MYQDLLLFFSLVIYWSARFQEFISENQEPNISISINSDRKCILCGSCHKLMLEVLLIVGSN